MQLFNLIRELTDPDHKTECRSTDQILRSDQPVWNSLLQFSDKHLSELIESTMKIFIWNRSSSFSDPELLGIVQIANKGNHMNYIYIYMILNTPQINLRIKLLCANIGPKSDNHRYFMNE